MVDVSMYSSHLGKVWRWKMNDQHFCLLCARHRKEPLTNIPLGFVDEGVLIKVDACKDCERILFNVRRIYDEEKRKWMEKKKREAQSILSPSKDVG